MLTLCFLTPYPSLLHSSTPFLSISLSPTSCALDSLFHHFLASILPLHLCLVPRPLLFFFVCSLVCIQYDIWKSKALLLLFHFHYYTERKTEEQKTGEAWECPSLLPHFIHPMPSLSTSPPALLEDEVTAVSTIWRAQPDNKMVSDGRSCRTQNPRPCERRRN